MSPSATMDDVGNAFLAQAAKTDPLRTLPALKEKAAERFRHVAFAHDVLGHVEKRKCYDDLSGFTEKDTLQLGRFTKFSKNTGAQFFLKGDANHS